MSKEKDVKAEIQALKSKLTGDPLTDAQTHSDIYELMKLLNQDKDE